MPARYLSASVTALLALHVLCLVTAPYTRHCRRLKRIAFILGALCILSLPAASWFHYSFKIGADTLLYTILLGNFAFLISLASARYSLKIGWQNFVFFYRRLGTAHIGSYTVLVLLVTALYEEVIWRAGIQVRLGNDVRSILIVAVLFYLAHVPPTRKFRIPRVIDLCALSLMQGVCYYAFESLTVVIGIHFIKNLCSHLIRYQKDPKYSAHVDKVRERVRARLRPHVSGAWGRGDSARAGE